MPRKPLLYCQSVNKCDSFNSLKISKWWIPKYILGMLQTTFPGQLFSLGQRVAISLDLVGNSSIWQRKLHENVREKNFRKRAKSSEEDLQISYDGKNLTSSSEIYPHPQTTAPSPVPDLLQTRSDQNMSELDKCTNMLILGWITRKTRTFFFGKLPEIEP